MAAPPASSNLTDIERDLVIACEGLLAEFDKLMRFSRGDPRLTHEAVDVARATIARTRAKARAR